VPLFRLTAFQKIEKAADQGRSSVGVSPKSRSEFYNWGKGLNKGEGEEVENTTSLLSHWREEEKSIAISRWRIKRERGAKKTIR